MKDYFEILQVNENDDLAMIEKAYQDMLLKYPSNNYPAENSDIIKAYRMLTGNSTIESCLNFHRMESISKQVYSIAEKAVEEGRYDVAIKNLEKAIKLEKHNDHLYKLLGVACLRSEKYTKAVKAFDRIINKYSYDSNVIINHTEACIAGENYKKAITSAKKGYEVDKDNILFTLFLVKGYVHTRKYGEAEGILKEAMNNPAFWRKKHNICARLAFVLSLENKFSESLEYMEKLVTLDAANDEKTESGEMLMNTLDYYLEYQMYTEANRCMGAIIKLLPDREDIVSAKKNIEKILKLEPEFHKFEEDDTVPDGLVGLVVNELFPEASTGMNEKQKKAYAVMNEYQILHEYSIYLMPLRYIKTKYPNIYTLKKEFFDELQDSRRRKILKTKYQSLVYQYQAIFEEMMDEWDEEYDDDDDGEDNENSDSAGTVFDVIDKLQEPVNRFSNVRPFVRREDKAGRNDPCPCGSGEKYMNCCGKEK